MGERVTFKSNGSTASGYLARPAKSGPGLIVIQEWWGLVPHIEQVADRFADAGFVAIAPDLYHGAQATSPDEAGKLMMALRIDDAARDLAGAIDYVTSQRGVAGSKVGTIGFCMGGALSLFAASKNSGLGKRHEFHTYDAQHAFFNDQRPEVYDAKAAADAWDKTLAFFRRELGK